MEHEIPVGSTFGNEWSWWTVRGYTIEGRPVLSHRDTQNTAYWGTSEFTIAKINQLGYKLKFPAEKKRRGFAQFITDKKL